MAAESVRHVRDSTPPLVSIPDFSSVSVELGSPKTSLSVFSFLISTGMSSFSHRNLEVTDFSTHGRNICFSFRWKCLDYYQVFLMISPPPFAKRRIECLPRSVEFSNGISSFRENSPWNGAAASRISLGETEERGTDADERGVHSIHVRVVSRQRLGLGFKHIIYYEQDTNWIFCYIIYHPPSYSHSLYKLYQVNLEVNRIFLYNSLPFSPGEQARREGGGEGDGSAEIAVIWWACCNARPLVWSKTRSLLRGISSCCSMEASTYYMYEGRFTITWIMLIVLLPVIQSDSSRLQITALLPLF